MKFKFIGVPGERHESLNMFGTVFPLGEAVEIEGKGAEKLKGHPHFEQADEEVVAKVEPTIEELRIQAEALGVDVDQRWGVKRLAEEISKKAG